MYPHYSHLARAFTDDNRATMRAAVDQRLGRGQPPPRDDKVAAPTQAASHVVPVAVTAAEQVERLRAWASGRCLSASSPGIYRRDGEPPPKAGRRVQRGPGNN